MQNLIANAVKFRGEAPPVITVDAEPAADGIWTFSVTDNGVGLPDAATETPAARAGLRLVV